MGGSSTCSVSAASSSSCCCRCCCRAVRAARTAGAGERAPRGGAGWGAGRGRACASSSSLCPPPPRSWDSAEADTGLVVVGASMLAPPACGGGMTERCRARGRGIQGVWGSEGGVCVSEGCGSECPSPVPPHTPPPPLQYPLTHYHHTAPPVPLTQLNPPLPFLPGYPPTSPPSRTSATSLGKYSQWTLSSTSQLARALLG